MMKRILAAVMVLVMVFSCVPFTPASAATEDQAVGTTYYVSSLNGAENNAGTSEDAPFSSLLKINDITLQPGDKVLLERGSVFQNEYLHLKGAGSVENPIIIDVYGDESQPKPLIATNGYGVWYQDYGRQLDNANHVYQGNVSSCILLKDVEYIEIRNIAMTNEGNYGEGEVYNSAYRMDRTGVAGVAQNIGTVDHIVLENLDIRNVEGNVYNKHMCNGGIYFVCHLPDDESATGISRYDDVQIIGCNLDNVNRWGIAVGYTIYHSDFPYANTIPDELCETYGSSNVYIANNYLKDIGGDAITTMYCFRPLIEYNVADGYCQDITDGIYDYEYNRGGQVAAGIWPWMCKTPVFQYNECYDSTYNQDGQAWDADWGDGCIYQYNYSSNNAGGAVMFCGTWACNTIFRYNISQNDLSGVLNLAGSPNGEIHNNVFYIKEGVKINRTGMSGGRGNTVYNNIFYYAGETPANATLGNWGDITAQWSNNIYYNYATTPDDPYAITADPMFVNAGSAPAGAQESGKVYDRSVFNGYKLQENSPAIDAGMAVTAKSKVGLNVIEGTDSNLDFFGNKLDLIPDIGVYEAGICDVEADDFVRVTVEAGSTVTLTDRSGHYSAEDGSGLDTAIASVAMEQGSETLKSMGEAITALENGKYAIFNTRARKILRNVSSANSRLLLGSADTLDDTAVWTITGTNGGYYVQDANSKYMTIPGGGKGGLTDSATVLTIATSPNTAGAWQIGYNGQYLNDHNQTDAGGYSVNGDGGSQWAIHKINEEAIDVTELTFTGVKAGTTDLILGGTLYRIVVTGEEIEVDEADLDIVSTVYMVSGQQIHVPSAKNNESTVAEVLGNIEISENASAAIVLNGEVQENQNISEDMVLRISAGDIYRDYDIVIDNVYDYDEDYSFDHQGNVWFYQYIDANGNYVNMTVKGGYDDWNGNDANAYLTVSREHQILTNGILCGAIGSRFTEKVAAMAWRAPKSGDVVLSFGGEEASGKGAPGGVKLRSATGDNGGSVYLWITKNGEQICEPIQVTGTLQELDDITVTVEKGDYIRLEAHNEFSAGSTSLANPSFWVTPIVTYAEMESIPEETTPEVTEPDGTEPNGTEPDGTEPDGTEPEDTKPEETKPEETKPEETKPEETKPEETKPEETKPVVPECPKDENCVLSQFADIKVDDWYHDGIHFCVEEGIMNGMGEGKFAPNEPTTRAQLVTMLYRLEGEPTIEGKTEPFADVAETDWFYAPIVWAYNNKVVNGVSDTKFAPNANVTREQVATILYRFLGSPEGEGKLDEFPDVTKVSDYAVDALTWAVGAKLITGVAQPDGTTLLDPAGNATRAQIATILMRHLTA